MIWKTLLMFKTGALRKVLFDKFFGDILNREFVLLFVYGLCKKRSGETRCLDLDFQSKKVQSLERIIRIMVTP